MSGNEFRTSRRRVVGGIAGAGLGAGLAGGRLGGLLAARRAPSLIQGGGKLTYWGGLIFSDEANAMLEDTINAWGEANGVETEVVMINQNETNQKVSAAVESNTMPSALDLGLDLALLLTNSGQLIDLNDLYGTIGTAQGGWHESVDGAIAVEKFGGIRPGIPFGASGNVLFRRQDILDEVGITGQRRRNSRASTGSGSPFRTSVTAT
jgi:multiple sugar transport system substrate-binding protein